MSIPKIAILSIAMLSLTACGDAEWHTLKQLTPKQKESASYKFLVRKFGANHLLTECAPQEAAMLGGEYLIQVMGSGDSHRVGVSIGHGENMQSALDNAAASYISSDRLIVIEEEIARDRKEEKKREDEYRKKCCEVAK